MITNEENSKEFNDKRFDWYSLLNTEWFKDLESEIFNNLSSRSSRGLSKSKKAERDINERLVLNQILSALYQAYFTLPVGIQTVSIQLKEKEYKGSRFSFSAVTAVLKTLEALYLIKVIKGMQGKHITRIYPSKGLAVLFDSIGLRWAKQQPNPPELLIALRTLKYPNSKNPKQRKKKVDLEVPEVGEVFEARKNLYRINTVIVEHCISLDLDDSQLAKLSNEIAKRKKDVDENAMDDQDSARGINLHNVQLRRIFSRGSLSKGGRFYGGWWQGLPGIYRQHILIDGYKTAEVDYSTISLRILYAQQGIEVPLGQDLYDLGLDDWLGKTDPRRDHIKTYVNAALNDELDYFKLSDNEQEATGLTHEQLKAMIAKTHKPIADLFNTGIGLDTQYIDSRIAEQVMLRMNDEGHVVLPIHDSFIVRLGYEYRLREIMLEAFRDIVGADGRIAADYPRLRHHFGLEQAIIDEEYNDPSSGVVDFNEMSKEFLSGSLMDSFTLHRYYVLSL